MKNKSRLSIFLLFTSITTLFSQVSDPIHINDTLSARAMLIHSEDFEGDLYKWVKEVEPSEHSFVTIENGKLDINVGAGCSVWYIEKMDGKVLIEFDAVIIEDGGVNDNVQDLNTYWMANDPKSPDDIFALSDERGGIYRNYFPMSLYYVGLGETQNRRSRFRRYDGKGKRPWLPEHDLTEPEFLLTSNQLYRISIVCFDNIIQYYRNDELLYELNDPTPFTSGYFCFRTVKNHMTIDNFKVYQLNEN